MTTSHPIRKKKMTRRTHLDILNILAILAVLFLHHDFGVHSFNTGRSWFFDLILKILMYFCIPVFLMCTGTTLLGYKQKYNTKVFFKKRLVKILVPMIAWFTIMTFVRVVILKDISLPTESPSSFLNFLMSSGPCDFYWYLFLIIGIYLAIPIFSPLSERKNKEMLQYSILALFLFGMVLPNISELFGVQVNSFLLPKASTWMIYPFIGFYISKYNLRKRARVLLYYGAVLALVYQFTTAAILSYQAGTAVLTTLGYLQFATAIYSTAIFCFIKNLNTDKLTSPRVKSILSRLAGCSFGIYLCHFLVMKAEKFALRSIGLPTASWAYRFLCPFLTYALCVGLVLILKKIPFGRRIVP